MAEEKKNPVEQQKTADTAKTLKDADKAINGEKLSEDELDAVAGGHYRGNALCSRLQLQRMLHEANRRYRNR